MFLTFARPIWLLLLLALPAIAFLALRMSYASLGPFQKWLSLGLRVAVWTLLVFALAGVQFVRKSDRLSVVIVRDASDSVDEAQYPKVDEELVQALKRMKKDDSLGKVIFGADAQVESLPQPGVTRKQLESWQAQTRGNFSNLGQAIQLAVASFPANAQKRLVLLTDGNENVGSALAETRAARDNGVEIVTVPMPTRTGPEVVLSSLEAPGKASIGERVNVRFVVDSTVATPSDVSLIRNGEFVNKVRINIKPGKEVYEFPVTVDQSGFFTYELALEPQQDTITANNRAYTYSVVAGKPRLLYATGDPNEPKYLPQLFQSHNIACDVVPPSGIPYNLADFQMYDGLILSDVAAYDITDDQMKMIQVLTRDFGRGFTMIGGEKSFGPGGYFDTPIEETLPVEMDFRRKRITPSTLVVCLVDKSGSMAMTVNGTQKVYMAREACKAVVKLQQPQDWVAVMGFDSTGQWVVEPTQGGNKEDTLAKLNSMEAGGGTDLYSAMVAAVDATKGVPVQIKHFLIFTDGIVEPGDFQGITSDMRHMNYTVSTVAFGVDADVQFLADLAKMGGGNAYTANSLYDLPKIFTREVFMANRATLNEEPFLAQQASDSPLVSSIRWANAPLLYGYVATSAKDRAQVHLTAKSKDPLLATWRYGLGKSAAFTSDAKNRWGRDWLGWDGYERFWMGLARWMRSDLSSGGMDVNTSIRGNEGVIKVNATGKGGEFVNLSKLEALVTDPEVKSETIELHQVAPGQYEGRFPIKSNGNYFVNVVQKDKDESGVETVAGTQASGLAVSYSPEYRELKPNNYLLNQLQSNSLAPSGLTLPDLFSMGRKPVKRVEDAWELFTLLAIVLWLFDIAARRLVMSWQDWQLVFATVLYGGGVRKAVRTRESLEGLLRAKQRTWQRTPIQPAEPPAYNPAAEQAASRSRLEQPPAPTVIAAGTPEGPAGKIEAAPSRPAAAQPEGLSNLRQRMAQRDPQVTFKPGAPLTPPGAPAIPAAPAAPRPEPERGQQDNVTGAREMTSRLLEKKRQRGERK